MLRRILSLKAGHQAEPSKERKVISKSIAPRNTREAGESWTLASQPRMHVLQERMPPGRAERRHLHSAAGQLCHVLKGVATVRSGDHEETLSRGDGVHVPAGAPRQLRNDSPEPLGFLAISSSPPRLDQAGLDRA